MSNDDAPIEIPGELTSVDIRPDRTGTIAAVVQALATVAVAIILAVQL